LAAVPQLINFQGILRDGGGNPVANGSYSVQFTIYDAASGGTNLWTETQSVTTVNGLFTVLLGSGPIPLNYSIFNDSTRWLGVKVGADPEMTPRQRISSVGYSHNSSEWTSADSNLFRLKGNIGVGASPAIYTKLRVNISALTPNTVTAVKGDAANTQVGTLAYGGHFTSTGTGVFGSGLHGVRGEATGGNGVYGYSSMGTGVYAYGASNGIVSYGDGASSSPIYGCYSVGSNSSTGDAYGGRFEGSSTSGTSYGVYGTGNSYGVYGNSTSGTGVYGISTYQGVYGEAPVYGVYGNSASGTGVLGYSSNSYGVNGSSNTGTGVYGTSTWSYGVYGSGLTNGVVGVATANGGSGVYGSNGGNPSTYAGYFVGTLYCNGTAGNNTGVWSNLSDRRLKKEIEPIQNALETVGQLQPVSFRWKDEKKDAEFGRVRGLIAQDVEKVIPEWIKTNLDGYKQIEPIGVDALLIEAIKELKAENEDLRERILKLERGKQQAHVE
jgi:hypothetical protein